MKERPILFPTDMIRALLDGRKTMTRRVIKPCDNLVIKKPGDVHLYDTWDDQSEQWITRQIPIDEYCIAYTRQMERCVNPLKGFEHEIYTWESTPTPCPYGRVGDRLWVKETWGVGVQYNGRNARDIIESVKPGSLPKITYKADDPALDFHRWRSGRFMPRWASRITLEITAVRSERLQDISHEDAIAEGILGQGLRDVYSIGGECLGQSYAVARWDYELKRWRTAGSHFSERDSFRTLWDSLNAKRGYPWASNPAVWVVGFKVVESKAIEQ